MLTVDVPKAPCHNHHIHAHTNIRIGGDSPAGCTSDSHPASEPVFYEPPPHMHNPITSTTPQTQQPLPLTPLEAQYTPCLSPHNPSSVHHSPNTVTCKRHIPWQPSPSVVDWFLPQPPRPHPKHTPNSSTTCHALLNRHHVHNTHGTHLGGHLPTWWTN